MDISKLVVGQEVFAIGAFSKPYAKKGNVANIAPWGVEVQTEDEMLRFDTNGKGCDGNVRELDYMPFVERTAMLERAERAEETRKYDKTTAHSASEHAGEMLLQTFGIGAVKREFQAIFDQVTAEHPDWTIGNRLEEAEKRAAE